MVQCWQPCKMTIGRMTYRCCQLHAQVVAQTPDVPTLVRNANVWISSILRQLDTANATMQFLLFPFNIKTTAYPMTPTQAAALVRNNDYNLSPVFKNTVLWAAGQPAGYTDLVGPLPPSPANCAYPGFCARQVLWLPTNNPNETWGNNVTFTAPWIKGPDGQFIRLGNATAPRLRADACGANCTNYDPRPLPDGRWLVYWGFINHCVSACSTGRVKRSVGRARAGGKMRTEH